MKKNTPVIMGVLLILGIVALGYFADLDNKGNNSTNNSTNYSFLKYQKLTNQSQSSQPVQTSTSSDPPSDSNTVPNNNNNNNTTNQNTTVSSVK